MKDIKKPYGCFNIDRFRGFLALKATYVLIIYLSKDSELTVGALGEVKFKKGYYAYVGSALGGLKKRLKRHLSSNKQIRWHIDYFLSVTAIIGFVAWLSPKRLEYPIAKNLSKRLKPIQGFGSSDSRCKSHLFFSMDKNKLLQAVIKSSKAKNMILFEF
ncbi:GIY-YIG nuclease family protein [Hippea maritima]|uniref:GIY-YIG domain-containing protein n=1 Tax=Hippea maritima (strain ATCC 700847 / DSM 10411 / MH2) TaxID=760142 RepID=F2LVU0_HIPMA|nr:GIY-YIG nuclease family protein [Hippea maritima]AEA33874.1 protein of unknown function DUF123 [Hippea maritima DSM 10411]